LYRSLIILIKIMEKISNEMNITNLDNKILISLLIAYILS